MREFANCAPEITNLRILKNDWERATPCPPMATAYFSKLIQNSRNLFKPSIRLARTCLKHASRFI